MKKRRTGSIAGEGLASPAVATVQVPLPLLEVLADARTAFFGGSGTITACVQALSQWAGPGATRSPGP
jgi:hypothetical protein